MVHDRYDTTLSDTRAYNRDFLFYRPNRYRNRVLESFLFTTVRTMDCTNQISSPRIDRTETVAPL